jgi:3-carboxy-cis,cis-muconate cycloisomerase
LASLGDAGIDVLHELSRQLELAEPELPWHTERTRLGEIASALGLTVGVLDKIALDITLLAQTEVGEVAEGGERRRGGSSTMPQKRNPVGSVLTRACAQEAQANVETLMRAMTQEHERAAGVWHAEWQALTGALALTGGAAAWLVEVMDGLEVYPERMRENLAATRGAVMAERITLLLAERVGRDEAHELMRSASRRANQKNCSLREVLLADDSVRHHLSVDEIERAMDPATYLGSTHAFVDRALSLHGALQED